MNPLAAFRHPHHCQFIGKTTDAAQRKFLVRRQNAVDASRLPAAQHQSYIFEFRVDPEGAIRRACWTVLDRL
ncbi:hypothetical protein [Mesorhizobium sp. 1M-11]|uniref:hypothetical protein n=1 Tax=Mesorhizobium sp. 1M-11 TaxID=1529006 RepID=UPI0006C75FC0|nr:hypothetical protein [Mesorhizobium sp. 1M-11]